MNISEFNAAYERQFHFYEMPEYANSRNKNIRLFKMAQWNPIAESYCGMLVPGIWHLNFKSEDDTPVPDDACIIPQQRLDAIHNPPKHIIVCQEKHSTYYYDAPDTETIGLTAIHILKNRAEQGCYYDLTQHSIDREDEAIAEPTHKPEDFPDDPDFAELARAEWERYKRHYLVRENEKKFRHQYRLAIGGNYVQAVKLLRERCCFEYEGFEFTSLTPINPQTP